MFIGWDYSIITKNNSVVFSRFNAVVRREEPIKPQHPRLPDASRGRNSDYDRRSHEYIPDRNAITNPSLASTANSNVGFTVNHVAGMQRNEDHFNQFWDGASDNFVELALPDPSNEMAPKV